MTNKCRRRRKREKWLKSSWRRQPGENQRGGESWRGEIIVNNAWLSGASALAAIASGICNGRRWRRIGRKWRHHQ
jgi:hypothetical protein